MLGLTNAASAAPPSYNPGGTVAATGAVAPGGTVSVTGTGWNISGCDGNISITGPNPDTSEIATATASSGGWTTSFVMSASASPVTRTYQVYCGTLTTSFQVVALVNTFTDVPNGQWYTESVEWSVARQITTGVGGTNRFEPFGNTTRGDAVTFMWRLAGSPTPPVAPPCGFSDIRVGSYFADAVCWAVNQTPKITTGIGGTQGSTTATFGPNRIVNRAQYITMLWRMAGAPTGAPVAGFTDVAVTDYFYVATNWAFQEGITTGVGGTLVFDPFQWVTRAQAVTFLQRFAEAEGTYGPASLSAALVAAQATTQPASSAPAIGNGIAMLVVVALGVGVGLQLLRPRRLHLRKGDGS